MTLSFIGGLTCKCNDRQVWFNEAMRHVVDDKEQQLDILRMREASLVEQCQRHQETIQQLTDNRGPGAHGYKFLIFI
jgi:hypothetical protein